MWGTNWNFNMSSEYPTTLESVEDIYWRLPRCLGEPTPLLVTKRGVQIPMSQATTSEQKDWQARCGELGIEKPNSGFDSRTWTCEDLNSEKVLDPSRKRAMSYPECSIRAVTSALKEPHEGHGRMMSQTESRPLEIKIERNEGSDYHKLLRDRLLSPLSGFPEDTWNILGSDDDSEIIFPFALEPRNDAGDGAHDGRKPSAKDIQLLTTVETSSLPPRHTYSRRSSQSWDA